MKRDHTQDAQRLWQHGSPWLLVVAIALLTYVLYPVERGFDVPLPEVGQVAAEQIVAPFAFDVRKTQDEFQRELDEISLTVRQIYDYRDNVVDSLLVRLDQMFESMAAADTASAILELARFYGLPLGGDEARYLAENDDLLAFRDSTGVMIRAYLTRGVAAPADLTGTANPEIVIRRGDVYETVIRDSVLTQGRYLTRRRDFHPDPESLIGDQVFSKVLSSFYENTVVLNAEATESGRESMRQTVNPIKGRVRANERIINDHEVVTAAHRERILALRQELLDQERTSSNLPRTLGQILTNGLIVSVFWMLLMLYVPATYSEPREMIVLAVFFGVVVAGAWTTFRLIHTGPELMPIPFAAIMITVLFNGRIAMVAAMVLAALLGSQAAYGGQHATFIALLGGVTAALSVRGIRRRAHILSSAGFVTLAFAIAAVTVGLRLGWSPSDIGLSAVRGMTNAIVSAALVFMALPIFESVSRRTTDLTLLELSDPSHPLLRRLATEVPGTYAHSVAVANLCEAGANAVGGNGLLARVGCYYHDVGKMNRPIHFAENQSTGGNPHDRLPPATSARIIREHVLDGVALAEEHHLPKAVRIFIPEHHGTGEIAFFLARARSQGAVTPDQEQDFRYPGPKPSTVETAIAMLADGVEAVIRVLDEPTPDTVRAAIDHVVKQRVEEGQLEEAPLTLGQIKGVKEAFVRTLSGMYHNRIDYPEASGGISARWSAASSA